MTASYYISNLFRVACQQLGCPYVKTTSERLQKWSIDENNKTFIALLGLTQDITVSFSQSNEVSFDLTLVACVETTNINPEDNYYNEEVEYYQNQVDELIGRFCNFVQKNEYINTMTYNIEEAFKDPQYLGIGRGFTMSITMNDVQDYCDDFSNNQTESI